MHLNANLDPARPCSECLTVFAQRTQNQRTCSPSCGRKRADKQKRAAERKRRENDTGK